MKINYLAIIALFMIATNSGYAADPAKGKTLSATCAACHGADGNSVNPVWPKLAGQHAKYLYKQLTDFKEGNRSNAQMSPMAAPLSNENMADIASYFSSQKTKRGAANPDLIETGEKIYRAGDAETGVPACMACHGPTGAGNPGALYPVLSGQHAEYIKIQLNAFKAGTRSNDANKVMRTIAGSMTTEQIEAVSEYIQGLH